MEGGVGWWKQITDAIEQVEFMIMVLTPAAMTSDVARKEWRYARQQGVRVCPVMGVPPSQLDTRALPSWMRKVHFYDLDKEWNTFVGFLNSASRDNRVPFMAPDLRDDYVQRPAEFEALLSALLDADRANPVMITTALQGAGGFGKTTLAIALCHSDDVISAFDDGILWVTLGQEPKIQHELTKLYAALTGERVPFIDIDDAAIHLAERLDQKNCLIVIDDAWDAQHVMPFMRGSLGAARSDQSVDSANSQFFITFGPNAMLDHHYTVYGRVIQGMDVVDKIAPGEPPADPTKIVHAKIGN